MFDTIHFTYLTKPTFQKNNKDRKKTLKEAIKACNVKNIIAVLVIQVHHGLKQLNHYKGSSHL